MSKLWSGSFEAAERANAEVLVTAMSQCWVVSESCRTVAALAAESYLKLVWNFCMLTVEIEYLNGFLLGRIKHKEWIS